MKRLVIACAALTLSGGALVLPAVAADLPTSKPTVTLPSLDGEVFGSEYFSTDPSFPDSGVEVDGDCGAATVGVTYSLSGQASGPYPGTFTESGRATLTRDGSYDYSQTYYDSYDSNDDGLNYDYDGDGDNDYQYRYVYSDTSVGSGALSGPLASAFTITSPTATVTGSRTGAMSYVYCSENDYVNGTHQTEDDVYKYVYEYASHGTGGQFSSQDQTWQATIAAPGGASRIASGTGTITVFGYDNRTTQHSQYADLNPGDGNDYSFGGQYDYDIVDAYHYSSMTAAFQENEKTNTAPTVTVAGLNAARSYELGVDTAPSVTCSAQDAEDGASSPAPVLTKTLDSYGQGTVGVLCSVTDTSGESATATASYVVKDTTAPAVPLFVGGPSDASTAVFGHTPAAPTCMSTDVGVGVASCTVTGYSTAVGPHTLTATATDNNGLTSVSRLSYTVAPYTLKGFASPVDMGGVLNTVKAGATVPLKFKLFDGATELTSPSAVSRFSATKGSCTSATEDAVDVVTTGSTVLRYDATAGQFVQNWKTPTVLGCYTVSMASADGSSLSALFKLK